MGWLCACRGIFKISFTAFNTQRIGLTAAAIAATRHAQKIRSTAPPFAHDMDRNGKRAQPHMPHMPHTTNHLAIIYLTPDYHEQSQVRLSLVALGLPAHNVHFCLMWPALDSFQRLENTPA